MNIQNRSKLFCIEKMMLRYSTGFIVIGDTETCLSFVKIDRLAVKFLESYLHAYFPSSRVLHLLSVCLFFSKFFI